MSRHGEAEKQDLRACLSEAVTQEAMSHPEWAKKVLALPAAEKWQDEEVEADAKRKPRERSIRIYTR